MRGPSTATREWPLLSTAREIPHGNEDSAQPPPKKIMIEGYPFCFWDADKILTPVLRAGYSDVLSL